MYKTFLIACQWLIQCFMHPLLGQASLCSELSHTKTITMLVMFQNTALELAWVVWIYLDGHRPQDELGLRIREVCFDLWRHANERTVGHNSNHTHGLKGELQRVRGTQGSASSHRVRRADCLRTTGLRLELRRCTGFYEAIQNQHQLDLK